MRDDDELRSEWVTVLRDADTRASGGQPVLLGFDGSTEHDGTLRIRRGADGGIEVWAEAFLGDAVLGLVITTYAGVFVSSHQDELARLVKSRPGHA